MAMHNISTAVHIPVYKIWELQNVKGKKEMCILTGATTMDICKT